MNTKTLLRSALLLALSSSAAMATTRSSFTNIDSLTGVSIVPLTPLSYQVSLAPGAAFMLGSSSYPIQNIIGFYTLSNTADFSPLASLPAIGNFADDSSNAGTGGIQGWKSNPNQGINANGTQTFTFTSLDTAHVDQLGLHVRLSSGLFPNTSGNTGNITVPLIPTPGSVSLALLGSLAAFKRRRDR